MKVIALVINDVLYDQRMQRICSTLVSENYNVELVGRKMYENVFEEEPPFAYRRMNCIFQRSILLYIEMTIRLIVSVLRNTSKGEKFILYAVDFDTLIAASVISWMRKCRVIYDAHEYFIYSPEIVDQPMKQKIWDVIGRFGMRYTSDHITVNHALAQELEKVYGKQFYVVRNVPLYEEVEVIEKSKILLYQGVVNAGRGIEECMDVMKYLSEYELWIVGEGEEYKELLERHAVHPARGQIKFMGYVLPTKLKEITKEARIGLNLLSGKSKNYTFSLANKFFDYMHAGVPSLNSDFISYRQIIENDKVGKIVKSLDVDQIVQAIVELDEGDVYRNMVENCMKAKKRYAWQEEKQVLISICNNLMRELETSL